MKLLVSVLTAVALAGPFGLPARAASKTDISIGPGPLALSDEERAVEPNPAVGEEHAVILLEELERDENRGTQGRTTFHLRAKVLSNEGRELANIEVPYRAGRQELVRWWGRTILPDGTVHELKLEQLEEQSLSQAGDAEIRAVKAALPGVVAGAVIDYGYEMVHHESFQAFDRIILQREQPVRQLRYRWRPSAFLPAGYLVSHTEGLDLHVTRDKESVLVLGHNLPAVPVEEHMPPEYDVRASVLFHYLDRDEGGKDFWELKAKSIESRLRWFCGAQEELARVVAATDLAATATDDRLGAAYRWIQGHVSSEEEAGEAREGRRAADVIEARRASDEEISSLFACMVRLFGGEAWVAKVTDRRQRLFDPQWPSAHQFAGTIAVLQGAGEQGELILAAPFSGLPLGQVPWPFSGGAGLLATAKGGRSLPLPPGRATDSQSRAEVDIAFGEDNQSVRQRFTLTGTGQVALERLELRRLAPRERATWVERRCRGYADEEVLRSEVSGLESGQASDVRLECETEHSDTHLDDSIGRYSTHWLGPWVESPPALPPGARFHPVVFDYPRADLAHVVVHAPHEFVTGEAPADVKLAGPYGKYELRVSRNAEAYTVDRGLALLPLAVPAVEYDALRSFLDEVARADRTALEFRRAAGGD